MNSVYLSFEAHFEVPFGPCTILTTDYVIFDFFVLFQLCVFIFNNSQFCNFLELHTFRIFTNYIEFGGIQISVQFLLNVLVIENGEVSGIRFAKSNHSNTLCCFTDKVKKIKSFAGKSRATKIMG